MLRLIIGGVTTALVGYAIKEACKDENCFGLWDEPSSRTKTTVSGLDKFNTLKQTVLDGVYQEFQQNLQKIKNLDLKESKKINLNNKTSTIPKYKIEIDNIADELYVLLDDFNYLLKNYNEKVSRYIEVSKNFKKYSKKKTHILSDAIVLSNTINDILNIKLVNRKDKLNNNAKVLLVDAKKVLEKFESDIAKRSPFFSYNSRFAA